MQEIKERIIKEAVYFIETKQTIRQVAEHFQISKLRCQKVSKCTSHTFKRPCNENRNLARQSETHKDRDSCFITFQ